MSFQCQSHSLQLNTLKWLIMAHERLNERLCNKDICTHLWPLNSRNALDGRVFETSSLMTLSRLL